MFYFHSSSQRKGHNVTDQTTTETAPFVSPETLEAFLDVMVKASGKHAKASRSLVSDLLNGARLIGRHVSEDDWTANLAPPFRKALAPKVGKASVKVYVSHGKTVTMAACGRPPISDALPLGKHWTDQRTEGRKPEGVNTYVKRVGALLKLATVNEDGHWILPEGYSLLGEAPKAAEPPPPANAGEGAQGSAGQSSDQEGGTNEDPAKVKAKQLEDAAMVIMRKAKAAAELAMVAEQAREDLAKFVATKAAELREAAKANA